MISKKAIHYLTDYRLLYDDIIVYQEKQCNNLESFLSKNNFSFLDIIEQLDKLDGVKNKSLTSSVQANKELDFLSELDSVIKTFEKSNLDVGLDYMETTEMILQRKKTDELLELAKKELVEREKYLTAIVRANERKHKIHLKLMNVVKELEANEDAVFNININHEIHRKKKIRLKLKKAQRLPMGTKRK